eukprot:CAMPEP_0177705226 /NCGR_PEP_ID=MMETSP0484_2-20121128/8597_1 /TAXON_ID=354590 /ORGANISM="Rhodomonas lens, Strain RHODO" /LENGTH=398 /DNA_ID=CAMNT_0019216643 /DNA_START=99 /DNA_END=1291 /DNA_ORIENTATION=+
MAAPHSANSSFNDYMLSLMPTKPAAATEKRTASSPPVPDMEQAKSSLTEADAAAYAQQGMCAMQKIQEKVRQWSALQELRDQDDGWLSKAGLRRLRSVHLCTFVTPVLCGGAAVQAGSGANTSTRGAAITVSLGENLDFSANVAGPLRVLEDEILARQFGGDVWGVEKSMQMVKAMPEDLIDSVVDGLEALHILRQEEEDLSRDSSLSGETIFAMEAPQFDFEISEDFPGAHPTMESTYNTKEMRMTGIKLSRRFCHDMLGLSEEECLTRLVTKDTKLPMPELEMLTDILESFLSCLSKRFSEHRYYVWSPGLMGGQASLSAAKAPLLVKVEINAAQNGHLVTEIARFVPVSAEEYDQARLSQPSRCRPFFAHLGDLRTARLPPPSLFSLSSLSSLSS